MIRYTLTCDKGHGFDSWFQNAAAYESLMAAGQLTCPVCGAPKVQKSLMAPAVRPARNTSATGSPPHDTEIHDPESPAMAARIPDGIPDGMPAKPSAGTPGPRSGPQDRPASYRPDLSAPASELEAKLAELRRQIEAKSEYVGMNFAAEARRIHDGEATARSIYGEARPEDARKLLEDGVPVAPLPFLPARKVN